MADRYTYISLIGISLILIWGLGDIWKKYRLDPKFLVALGLCTTVALSLAARRQATQTVSLGISQFMTPRRHHESSPLVLRRVLWPRAEPEADGSLLVFRQRGRAQHHRCWHLKFVMPF